MEHLFRLKQRKTNIKTEIAAGVTTYCSMIYIIGIVMSMMVDAGMQEESVFFSVLFSSAIGCMIMGFFANYPVALAPSLGVTALFSTTICGKYGFSWKAGLAAIFLEGFLFLFFSASGLRKLVIKAIPTHLKYAISAGIGCFLSFTGLKNSEIVVSDKHNLIALGKIYDIEVFVSLFGLIVLLAFVIKKVKFPILKGISVTALVGFLLGLCFDSKGLPHITTETIFSFSGANYYGAFVGGFEELFSSPKVFVVLISILYIDLLDTTGILISIIDRMKLPTVEGEPENIQRALISDALSSIVGSVFGSTSVSSYMESEIGIATGGRTGLTTVTTGVLLLLSIFLYPIFSLMTKCVTSPALIIVGTLMIRQFGKINWHDYVEAVSSFAIILMMIVTVSISDGIAFGFIIYGVTALFSGRYKEVSPLMWVMIGMFCVYFILV